MGVKVTVPNNSGDYVTFGSANTPTAAQIGGYDDGSSNGHLELYTTASGVSTERMRIDSSGNLLLGTTTQSGSAKLTCQQSVDTTVGGIGIVATDGNGANISRLTDGGLTFRNGGSERMRIDSSGNLLVGTTSAPVSAKLTSSFLSSSSVYGSVFIDSQSNSTAIFAQFRNGSGALGSITNNNNSAVAYNTSSDYRLKENIQPMQNALGVVAQLNPVTYTWKESGSDGQGFIAHELQAVVPDCVTGEKDAVDAEGKPVYQGIDTSFLVATLTKAIQELSAKNDALETRIAALEAK